MRFSVKDEILFTDDFFNPVVRKDELTKSTYVFIDQLYKIIQYKDIIDVIQLTRFSERIPYLNIQKLKNGKVVKTFIIEANSKLIGDYITSIAFDDYRLIDNAQFELLI